MDTSWHGLLPGLAILAIFVSAWTLGFDWLEARTRLRRELFGILVAGAGVILLMLVPFEVRPGVITDLRGSLIIVAGFLGSPLIGAAAGLIAAAFRAYLGGAGAVAGIVSIALAAAVGIGGRFLLRGRMASVRDLLIVAAASSIAALLGFFVLPPAIIVPTFAAAGPAIAVLSFVAVTVMGLTMTDAERRRQTARANVFYRSIIDALPEPVNAKDREGRFLAANPATARQVNAPDVAALIGKTYFDFFPWDVAEGFRADEERVLAAGEAETVEQVISRDGGSRQWLSTLKVPLRDRTGEVIGLLTHNHDITDRKLLQDEIAEGRRRLNEALKHMADGLAMFDKDARLVLCNEQYRAMFPKTADLRVPGTLLEDILRASAERGDQTNIPPGAIEVWIEQTLAGLGKPSERDIQLADGRWLTARSRPTADGGSLTVFTDVTKMKHAEEVLTGLNQRLADLASQDGLTGLMNRRGYDEALQRAFAQSRRSRTPLSLMFIDVDHFKAYNDTYGHLAGDDCLRTISNLLKHIFRRPSDVAARYGGEEFAAILPDTPEEGAKQLAETLRQTINAMGMKHAQSPIGVVTISIGVATVVAGGATARPDVLAARADAALYQAKATGRNRVISDTPRPLAAAG